MGGTGCRSARHEDGVDDVDDAVAGLDVGGDDGDLVAGGVGQRHGSVVGDVDGEGGAVDGGDFLPVESDDVGGEDFTGDDVVGENRGEVAGWVFEQCVDRAGGECREGFVGWGEHRERAFAAQRFFEAGCLDGGDEGGEVTGCDGGVDDVGFLSHLSLRRRRRGHLRLLASSGHEDGVDDVDDAVAGLDVGGDDADLVAGGVGQRHRSVVGDVDGEGGAVDGGDFLAVESDDVGGEYFTGDDVVGEDRGEVAGGVFEQCVDGAGGECREGVVGWGEHRERAFAAQCFFEAGCLDGGDEGGEVTGCDGGVDDVGFLSHLSLRRRRRGHLRRLGHRGGGLDRCVGRIGVGVVAVVAARCGEQADGGEARSESNESVGHLGELLERGTGFREPLRAADAMRMHFGRIRPSCSRIRRRHRRRRGG